MEKLYEHLKDFLLTKFNEVLPQFSDDKCELPLLEEKNIVFGVIDPIKTPYSVTVSIYPESQKDGEELISDVATESNLTVTFAFRSVQYDQLVVRMCRYTNAFKLALSLDYTLNGSVDNSMINGIQFYPDCGTAERQMTASEIEITILTSEEL